MISGISRNTRQAAASQVAIKAKKETPPKVNLYGPKGGRRYLTKDDPDLFNDKNAEVMPTPKRRKLIQNPESPQHNKGQLISE